MSGLMVVRADGGRWVVPSTRAIWVPAGMAHAVDCIAEVHMRSLYVEPDFAPQLPDEAFAVQVAPLLRELLGGYESARRVHFFGMAALVAFVVVHLAMVALVPRTFLTMIHGRAPKTP